MKKTEKDNSIHFSNSFPSPLHIHISFFYLSFKKKHIEGGGTKKRNLSSFSTLSLSLITTHIDTSHLYLYGKNKHKNIRKGSKKKEKRKGEEILKIFEGTSLSVLSSFDLVFPIFIF